jgi:hypothetical protein
MIVGQPARLAWSLAGACVALMLSSLVLLLAVSHAGDVSQYYYEDPDLWQPGSSRGCYTHS